MRGGTADPEEPSCCCFCEGGDSYGEGKCDPVMPVQYVKRQNYMINKLI